MNLEVRFNQLRSKGIFESAVDLYPLEFVNTLVDLTLLQDEAMQEQIEQLEARAHAIHAAAICVYPKHLRWVGTTSITKATVVNFPTGREPLDACFKATDLAMEWGASEIDYVFDYQSYLQGEAHKALTHCQSFIEYCQNRSLKTKIIMESGLFPDMERLYEASRDVASLGCDFLKTSTGKASKGASPEAFFAMSLAIMDIGNRCGIKVSGGIRNLSNAQEYCAMAEEIYQKKLMPNWFRIGSSQLA